ncbi:Zn-dependent hydrolase [Desulfobacter hydrogenophilus]|uniref:MBL fold metallo-hydrolase n=1 Tax=Desulfobacter hydrogenophilus TaxID=2291 RepID=A0A328FGF8_9BACT|nr:MBL fold metallo-hydrolase [Desulfobacter hydrogenophilus]NDY71035.1 MBL fold metallo-hydrolase [Desulfobacter hydrogenophilus]QBH11678.1 MBL fold metallo-hydrolase [Desulfobacter hydrogenophilus]RAM02890.1 Zn-dependent hydrolase [Desulfobacter hydrogenophilus]
MKTWYIPEDRFPIQVTPGVQVIGNYYFNLMLITGKEKTVLFEAGVSGIVDQVIRQLGMLEISPDIIVVSHPHADHVTGLPGLADRFKQARIIAGPGAKTFMTHPKAASALIAEDRFISRRLGEEGLTPGRPSLDAPPDAGRIEEIAGPARLNLGGGLFFDLLPAKGHSPGALMGLAVPDQVLCCADALGFHYPGRDFWPLFFTGAADYLDTIKQIKTLTPEIICPAHQGPIMADNVSLALEKAESKALEIIKMIKGSPLNDMELVEKLFEMSYKNEFCLYTKKNVTNCAGLLVKRAREYHSPL